MSVTIDGSASVTINSGAILGITSGTAVASTSGTSIDFTSIPSWVKRITVMFAGVSTNGTSKIRIQIGAGSVETTGYAGTGSYIAGSVGSANFTSGFELTDAQAATAVRQGAFTLTTLGSNIWVMTGAIGQSDSTYTAFIYGSKTTSGTLDRVRITTVNGTDTFDAGTINILYE
jgi:hypothetical protein